MTDLPQDVSPLPNGYRLSHYRITQLIRTDVLGPLYRAFDERLQIGVLMREYAPTGLIEPGAGARFAVPEPAREAYDLGLLTFVQEAGRLAPVRSPGVTRTIAVHEANGTAYWITEDLVGEPLIETLGTEEPPDLHDLSLRFLPMIEGLLEAHRRGAVHASIRPQAVVIDGAGRAVLGDFGFTRWTLAVGLDQSAAMLNAGYSAPEQHRGMVELRPCADIYAVGALFYQVITGAPPPSADRRLERDRYLSAIKAGQGRYPWHLLSAIDAALTLDYEARPASLDPLHETLSIAALPAGVAGPVLAASGAEDGAIGEADKSEPAPPKAALAEAMSASVGDREDRRRWGPLQTVVAMAIILATGAVGWLVWTRVQPTEDPIVAEATDPAAQQQDPSAPLPGTGGAATGQPADPAASGDEDAQEAAEQLAAAMDDQAAENDPQTPAVPDEPDQTAPDELAAADPAAADPAADEPTADDPATDDPTANDPAADEPLPDPTATDEPAPDPQQPDQPEPTQTAVQPPDPAPLPPSKDDPVRDCPECPELADVAAGGFWMGSIPSADGFEEDEGPVRYVEIPKPFRIGRYEVTIGEWKACVAAGGCDPVDPPQWATNDDHPVTGVSWADANAYADWLSEKTGRRYRLPSEAEWEYAARGGGTTKFPWGDSVGSGNARCIDCTDQPQFQPTAVGSFQSNAFGLSDMAGNASEWVADCYRPSYRNAPSDGSAVTGGACKERVLRGGSWNFLSDAARSAARDSGPVQLRSPYNGFRVLREIESP
ncbi:MAG: SUMF1/EgtB/PvdO family nonheme iron enzyme [Alphaproteobacteria bacterium]|nr:SUMF1/EgtB/PvdO family nonheme iron enzyme [Alphaproteobacteria bacterium]